MIIELLIGLIICMIPIIVVILIITAIIKKNNKEEKNNFDETIRNIYVYIILIITLVAIISGVIVAFRIGLDIILPEESVYGNIYNNQQQERNANIIEFSTTLSLVVAAIPVFIYHNKLVKQSKEKIETINK